MPSLSLTPNSFDPLTMIANRAALQTAFGSGGQFSLPPNVIAYNPQIGIWEGGIPLILRGQGMGITRLYPTWFADRAIEFGLPPGAGNTLQLSDFDIVGGSSAECMHIQNTNALLEKINFTYCNGYGLHLFQAFGTDLDRCTFSDIGGLGLYVEGPQSSNALSMRKCNFFSVGLTNSRPAILLEGGDAIYIGQPDIEVCYAGIQLQNCRGVHIDVPYMERFTAWPFNFSGNNAGIKITGGWIGGWAGQPQSNWYVSNVNNFKVDGTTLFNMAVQIDHTTTSNVDFSTATLVNSSVTTV